MSEVPTAQHPVVDDDDPLGNPYLGSLKLGAALGLLGGALATFVGGLMSSEGDGSATGPIVLLVGLLLLIWAGLAQLVFWVCAAVLFQRPR